MAKIVSLFSQSPFVGTWIDDSPIPHEVTITAVQGELVIRSEMILEEGDIVEDPDEKLNCVIKRVGKGTLEYITWYDSIGRRACRTVTATGNKDILLTKITYSDVTPAEKISSAEGQPIIYGTWKPTNDDFWSEYRFSKQAGQLNVVALESYTGEEYIVSDVQSGAGWISFEAETLSDGRLGHLKFVFDETGTNAQMHFTFTEYGHLYRIQ